jgi:hypothetical protein
MLTKTDTHVKLEAKCKILEQNKFHSKIGGHVFAPEFGLK